MFQMKFLKRFSITSELFLGLLSNGLILPNNLITDFSYVKTISKFTNNVLTLINGQFSDSERAFRVYAACVLNERFNKKRLRIKKILAIAVAIVFGD